MDWGKVLSGFAVGFVGFRDVAGRCLKMQQTLPVNDCLLPIKMLMSFARLLIPPTPLVYDRIRHCRLCFVAL